MLRNDLVKHLETYPASTLDPTTLRNLARMIDHELQAHDECRRSYGCDAEGRSGLAYFDSIFRDDVRASEKALADINQELELRGLPA